MNLILLIIAILPVYILGKYIYEKDKNREPSLLLFKFFLLGIASVLISFFITSTLSSVIPLITKTTGSMNNRELFIYVFLFVALIEEGSKFLMTYILGYNNKEFDEVYDMIVYASFVSLGFAFYENLIYIFLNKEIMIGLYRGLLAIPGHVSFAVFMGYFLGLAKHYEKIKNYKKSRLYKSLGLIVAVLIHGVYDFCCLSNNEMFVIVFFVFVINLFILALKKIREVPNIEM